jgi:hypothetical protein
VTCRMCKERGKTWKGDNPECGFESGTFDPDHNWACATMMKLRDLAEERRAWSDDQSASVIPLPDGAFIFLGWYKNRGRTETAAVLEDERWRPLTLEDAESAISFAAPLPAECGTEGPAK